MKIAYRLRFLPMIIGFLLTFASFSFWGATSLPYQDMTPELYARYLEEVHTAETLLLLSFVLFLAGIAYFIIIRSRYRKAASADAPKH